MTGRTSRFIGEWLWLIVLITVIAIPCLFAPVMYRMVGVLLALPAIAFVGWIRQVRAGRFRGRRANTGTPPHSVEEYLDGLEWTADPECTACRYDLRGLPDDARCPECAAERTWAWRIPS